MLLSHQLDDESFVYLLLVSASIGVMGFYPHSGTKFRHSRTQEWLEELHLCEYSCAMNSDESIPRLALNSNRKTYMGY